ncbi:MAG: DNA polymerase III subunit alpha [Pseudomonadota bacterium]|nr:DNA polymerase III subunit alpha [Pseudomonadota bacterium]
MSHADFVHLRLHSAYSLLEGAIKIDELAQRCAVAQMPAVAITDSGNLFGALEFSQICARAGVQPIIGCQLGISRSDETETREMIRPESEDIHGRSGLYPDELVFLVQNEIGYSNLVQLVSKYHLESGNLNSNQISLELVAKHSEGLIVLTAGPRGGVGRLLLEGREKDGEALLLKLKNIFPDRLYVELMRHNLAFEPKLEGLLVKLAYKYELPIVATNECFFMDQQMYEAHDALICISDGTYINQSDRRRLTREHRFKTSDEMVKLFADVPEAISNTLVIAQRCSFMVEERDPLLPAAPFAADGKKTASEILKNESQEGLKDRLASFISEDQSGPLAKNSRKDRYITRLNYELDIIDQMGFSGYFLVVADFVRWAKSRGISVGPGRGSGAGSLVAWALTITDLDPLSFGLLFERFLNPERVSMPDFDIDFCQERRDEVIKYVQEKYGKDKVAQIITFGTLQPRAALRDVGRVLEMPYMQVDRLCKLVPNNPANPVTLSEAIKIEPKLQEEIDSDSTVSRLVELSIQLEGLYRHASTHAAGVVICDRPLTQIVPLYRDPRSEIPVTQFAMKWAEASGLVKFDFLGLKTLTVIAATCKMLRSRNIDIDPQSIPLDDLQTFKMLGNGDTTGVFQLESTGMRDVLRKMQPDVFSDIIAIVALYRPGPMDNIPSYIRRKHGLEESSYLHPTLEPILRETYGIMIYQEQVMQIAQVLAGFTLGKADLLRRAMGKKIKHEMEAQRTFFIEGAIENGVSTEMASEIFDQVAKFAGYGFNKSHAAAYAMVAYQTAYLKANYPVEFIAASMTMDMQNTDKLNSFKQELDRLGIILLPPDINRSASLFSVESTHNVETNSLGVRYALAAIKNVGRTAMEAMTKEREANGDFKDIWDFSARLDGNAINKRQLENLAKAGAFDNLGSNRREFFENAGLIVKQAIAYKEEKASSQIGLFGIEENNDKRFELRETLDWDNLKRLEEEFDALGFYLSSHPLDAYSLQLSKLKVKLYHEIEANNISGPVNLAGVVVAKNDRVSQNGNSYAFLQLSDQSGQYEIVLFSEILSAHSEILIPGNLVFLNANAQIVENRVRVSTREILVLEDKIKNVKQGLKLLIKTAEPLPTIKTVLDQQAHGQGEVSIVLHLNDKTQVEVILPTKCLTDSTLAGKVEAIPGVLNVTEV